MLLSDEHYDFYDIHNNIIILPNTIILLQVLQPEVTHNLEEQRWDSVLLAQLIALLPNATGSCVSS